MKKMKKKMKGPSRATKSLPPISTPQEQAQPVPSGPPGGTATPASRPVSATSNPLPPIQTSQTDLRGAEGPPPPPPLPPNLPGAPPPPPQLPGAPPPPQHLPGAPPPPRKAAKTQRQKHLEALSLSDWLTGDELSNAKFMLKSPGTKKKKSYSLNRAELFDKHEVVDYFPLETLKDSFTVVGATITAVELIGVDQVTDMFFLSVHFLHKNSLFTRHVRELKLLGCTHLTDLGVRMLVKLFTNLESILLSGCDKITNDSIGEVMFNLSHLQLLNVGSTLVSVVPPLETRHSPVSVRVPGCPMVSPPREVFAVSSSSELPSRNQYWIDLYSEPDMDTYKVVIIQSENVDVSLIHVITKETVTEKRRVEIKSGWKSKDGATYNMYECSQNLSPALIRSRVICVLPFNLDADVNASSTDVAQKVHDVLLKVPTAVFCVVGVTTTGETSCTVEDLTKLLQERLYGNSGLQKLLETQKANVMIEPFVHMKAINFKMQQVFANAWKLDESLSTSLEKRLVTCSINTKDTKGFPALENCLLAAAKCVHDQNPVYRRLPKEVLGAMATVDNVTGGILKNVTDVAKTLREKHVATFGPALNTYQKLLELMEILGKLVLLRCDDTEYVCTDLEGLAALLSCSLTPPDDRAGSSQLEVHKDTPVWSRKALLDKMQPLVPDGDKETTVSVILNGLSLAWMKDDSVILMNHLTKNQPISVEDYMAGGEGMRSVKVIYQFLWPLPEHVVFACLHAILQLVSEPQLLWRSGIVTQETMATVCIDFSTARDEGSSAVSLQVALLSVPGFSMSCVTSVVHQVVAKYRVILEYIFKQNSLFYTYGGNHSNWYEYQVLSEGWDDYDLDADRRLSRGHKLNDERMCERCHGDVTSLHQLWVMFKDVWPSLSGQLPVTFQDHLAQRQGSWFTTMVPKDETKAEAISLYSPLTLEDFSHFSVHRHGGKNLSISVRVKGAESTTCYTLKKGGNEKGFVIYKDGQIEKTIDRRCFEQGEKVEVGLKPSKEKGMKELKFAVQDECVLSMSIASDSRCTSSISSTTSSTIFINAPLCPVRSSVAVWMVGMRLEAKDRKNPSLICVATVTEVNPSSEVLIHFDGWTSTYDYWATTDSEDLHPVGYIAHLKETKPSAKLEAPNRYNRTFSWDQYLEEVDEPPVPHACFTAEQTAGCPEYVNRGTALTDDSDLPGVLKSRLEAATRSAAHLITSVPDLHEAEVPFLFLPASLDVNELKYPRLRNLNSHKLHALCRSKECLHLVDMPGVAVDDKVRDQFGRLLKSMTIYACAALAQKSMIPRELRHLLPESGEPSDQQDERSRARHLAYQQMEQGIRRMLSLYMYLVLLDEPPQSGGQDIPRTWKEMFFTAAENKGSSSTRQVIKDYSQMCRTVLSQGVNDGTFMGHMVNVGTPSDPAYLCAAHERTQTVDSNLNEFSLVDIQNYTHLVTTLNLSQNSLTTLPANLFTELTQLTELRLAGNKLQELPPFGEDCRLSHLDVSRNKLTSLPANFPTCGGTLRELILSENPLQTLHSDIFRCCHLVGLAAANIGLRDLPPAIGTLTSLTSLDLQGHALTELPSTLGELKELKELNLSGLRWVTEQGTTAVLSREVFEDFIDSNPITASLDKKERDALFNGEGQGHVSVLDHKGIGQLNAQLYESFPRLGRDGPGEADEDSKQILAPVFQLENLEHLTLSFLGIKRVADDIKLLKKLVTIDVSHSPILESVSGEVGTLTHLKGLSLTDCSSLKTPPKEIVVRGFSVVYGYLRRLQMGSVTCKRTKLMMVGLGGAGKTSTVNALMDYRHRASAEQSVTDGIDITTWKVCYDSSTDEDNEVTYSVWDFAGQTVYYNTHQFFLSNRAVYLLMWNVRLGHEHAGLDFWLSSISCHAPKAPILVVGTHVDQVEKYWLPSNEMKKRYPQIVGFYAISTYTGEGVEKMARDLYAITLQEKYMGERIPAAWLNLEKQILKARGSTQNLLEWSAIEKFAEASGILDPIEIQQAVGFLHDLGSLQHFDNDFLKSKVVINPQWIVDVMSCLVSIHENAVKDGKLKEVDIPVVWADYDKELHPWLLRLTEEFDLTFSVPEEKCYLVPCLLPDIEPEFTWPDVSDVPDQHETKMVYKFEYLPAGLFNRVQVRLYQYSDKSVIWKKGSLLHKNGHAALLLHAPGSKVIIKVQGHKPENFLFLVHETFETLIMEAFNGVTYDYLIPCSDCIRLGTYDPCMFEASKIRRATELKVPFLQCDKYFHTLSMSEVHAAMPPDTNADFDAHLQQSLRSLKDLRSDMESEIFMFYCADDVPRRGQEDKQVSPHRIHQDLVKEGFKVWFPADPVAVSLKSVSLTMKNSKLILLLVSDKFVQNDQCCNVVYYAQQTLGKRCQVIVLGGTKWQKTNIGLQMAAEVYVKMNEMSRYPHKIKELIESIRSKTSIRKVSRPKCFISYCWSNSEDAISKGSRKVEGALGWGDPRSFKECLEKQGVGCWMDIERVGQGSLFEDIAEGLRHAKVVVACVSDEYARSKNCQMELRFALTTLRLPVIVVVVGTGYQWESTEVGMLTLGSPKLNCQYESVGLIERLVERVKELIPEDDSPGDTGSKTLEDGRQEAYQELLELAQRKFLRQAAGYAASTDTEPYPRLFLLDLATAEERQSWIESCGQSEQSDDDGGSPRADADQETNRKQFCIRILCEHEQGWHVPGPALMLPPMTEADYADYLSQVAPYAARMLAILQHTNLDLPCLKSEDSAWLKQTLQDKCPDESNFKAEYTELLRVVKELDSDRRTGGLAHCHLPNGKVVWLCPEHRDNDRISVVGGNGAAMDTSRGRVDTVTVRPTTPAQSTGGVKAVVRAGRARHRLVGAGRTAQVVVGYGIAKNKSETCAVM